jgi:hypothetical protein
MADLADAFQNTATTAAKAFEDAENPQTYGRFPAEVINPKNKRPQLGLVGGNEVSYSVNTWPDIESDLRGTTRPLTACPTREHLPPQSGKIIRNTTRGGFEVDATPVALKEFQPWAYPGTVAPLPLRKETCGRPEKY